MLGLDVGSNARMMNLNTWPYQNLCPPTNNDTLVKWSGSNILEERQAAQPFTGVLICSFGLGAVSIKYNLQYLRVAETLVQDGLVSQNHVLLAQSTSGKFSGPSGSSPARQTSRLLQLLQLLPTLCLARKQQRCVTQLLSLC